MQFFACCRDKESYPNCPPVALCMMSDWSYAASSNFFFTYKFVSKKTFCRDGIPVWRPAPRQHGHRIYEGRHDEPDGKDRHTEAYGHIGHTGHWGKTTYRGHWASGASRASRGDWGDSGDWGGWGEWGIKYTLGQGRGRFQLEK
jgi:hypothetical protein